MVSIIGLRAPEEGQFYHEDHEFGVSFFVVLIIIE